MSKIVSSLHRPEIDSHKGQNGKLLVIAGSVAYSGSALFALLAARRFVDLLYFHPGDSDPFLVQAVKSIPEAITVYNLDDVGKMDCVLFGGGMGGADFDTRFLQGAKKIVLDAEGFNYIPGNLLDSRFILTPHAREFERYFECSASQANVLKMAREHRCTILRKGTPDVITDGKRVQLNAMHNQGMTKGGTGDVLAGLTAALACTNGNFEAAAAAAYVNGLAGSMLQKEHGYNFCASDLADKLSPAYAEALKRKPF